MLHYHLGNTGKQISYPYTQRNTNMMQAFALSGYGDYTCDGSYFTERDHFKEYLILYTLEGKGLLRYNQSQVELFPETITIINCDNYQVYQTAEGGHWHFLWIHFTSPIADDLVKYIHQSGVCAPTMPASVFIHFYQSIVKLTSDVSSSSETGIALLIHTILEKVISIKASEIHVRIQNQKVNLDKAIVYIQDNFSRTITIDELADMANISKYYFIKLFKEMTGTTPYHFILLTRIDEAKRLIRQSDCSISLIGERIGFCDSKIFIHHFKKVTSVSPLQFRKKNMR
jgi:AraC-like DNA-binding protein